MSEDAPSFCDYCQEDTPSPWDSGPYGWCGKCGLESGEVSLAIALRELREAVREERRWAAGTEKHREAREALYALVERDDLLPGEAWSEDFGKPRIFGRSTGVYRWYDHPVVRPLVLSRWTFTRKGWHPDHKRLARVRALYWTLIRRHSSEICERCGGPVRVVYHAPDAVWEIVTGYARHPSGESAPGCLCPPCVDDLYWAAVPRGDAGYLRWTCATDDSVMRDAPSPDPEKAQSA